MLRKILACKPNNFQVEYEINPWMKPGTVNSDLALKQWENLMQAYKDNGIDVEAIDQVSSQPDMVFAADQGLVIEDYLGNKSIILSNFKFPERKGETDYYKAWFEKNNYKLEFLPSNLNFEGGGEIIPFNGKYFIGEGFRNSSKTYEYITEKFGLEFISLHLVNEKFYHLDTCFFILNQTTAFYYPKAFSQKSIEILKENIPNLIEFTEAEVNGFSANSVINMQTVFAQKGNPSFKEKLEKFGYKVVEVDLSEFIKSGGGIHCLTFELERVPHFSLTISEPVLNKQNQTINNSK